MKKHEELIRYANFFKLLGFIVLGLGLVLDAINMAFSDNILYGVWLFLLIVIVSLMLLSTSRLIMLMIDIANDVAKISANSVPNKVENNIPEA